MRLRILTILLMTVLALSVCIADDAKSTASTSSYLTPGASYNYKVNINVKGQAGTQGSTEFRDLDAALDLVVKHKVDKGIAPGEIQSVMSVQSAMITVGEQKIQLAASTFPQVTVLMDKNGSVTKVFGGTGPGLPGLNFSNFILLLLPGTPKTDNTELKAGDQWSKDVTLSDTGQMVKVSSTVKGTEKVGATDTLLVNQTFELVPAKEGSPNSGALKEVKGTAISNYSVQGLKPVKSHVEMEVVGTPVGASVKSDNNDASAQKDSNEFRAKISMDLAVVK